MSKWLGLSRVIFAVVVLLAVSPRVKSRSASAAAAQPAAQGASASAPALNYEFFKTRVEPIFLKKRPNHARCYVCHEGANHALKLAKLSPGETNWSEEESRRNFAMASALVTPGDPQSSILLQHPLAPEAGGDAFHSGGRQFESQKDPDWQTLADWVRGSKAN